MSQKNQVDLSGYFGRIGEDMTKGEENIVLNERDKLIQTIEAQQQMIFEANKQIQAQQQEIARIKRQLNCERQTVSMLKSFGLHYGEFPRLEADKLIDKLVADKDEQAKRIMQMDYLLRRALPILEATNNQQELIEQINELLGGKEDA